MSWANPNTADDVSWAVAWVDENTEKQGRRLHLNKEDANRIAKSVATRGKQMRIDVMPMSEWCNGQGKEQ